MIKMHIQQPWTDASAGDRHRATFRVCKQSFLDGHFVATLCLVNKPTM